MPNNTVKSFAEKTGKSIKEVERLWKEAKKAAEKAGFSEEKDPEAFFSYTTGILKKMLSIKESFSDFLHESKNSDYNGIYVQGDILDLKIQKSESNNLMKLEISGDKTLTKLPSVETLKSEYKSSEWVTLEKIWASKANKKSTEIEKLVNKFEKELTKIIYSMEKDLSNL